MPTEFGSPLWAGRTPRQRCRRGRAAARRRRRDHGQDRDHRIRLLPSRQDPQSARSGAHAGRLVERLGGGGRRLHGAGRDRLADQRLGDPPGGVLRRGRLQADARPDPAHRRAAAVARARPCRRVRAHASRTRRCWPKSLAGFDEEDPDTRPIARPPFAAVAASEPPLPPRFAFVRIAGLGAGRAGDARGVRRAGRGARRGRRRGRARRRASSARSTCTAPSWRWRWRTISTATTSRAATSSARRCAQLIERGRSVPAVDYLARRRRPARRSTRRSIDVFDEYDAILTPAAPGEAPRGLEATGNPVFCTHLDLSRHAGDHAAAAAIRSRPAARRAAGRPARQRRAPLAHGALACQNTWARKRPRAPAASRPRARKGKSP